MVRGTIKLYVYFHHRYHVEVVELEQQHEGAFLSMALTTKLTEYMFI